MFKEESETGGLQDPKDLEDLVAQQEAMEMTVQWDHRDQWDPKETGVPQEIMDLLEHLEHLVGLDAQDHLDPL